VCVCVWVCPKGIEDERNLYCLLFANYLGHIFLIIPYSLKLSCCCWCCYYEQALRIRERAREWVRERDKNEWMEKWKSFFFFSVFGFIGKSLKFMKQLAALWNNLSHSSMYNTSDIWINVVSCFLSECEYLYTFSVFAWCSHYTRNSITKDTCGWVWKTER
jgi:hypothetical protein